MPCRRDTSRALWCFAYVPAGAVGRGLKRIGYRGYCSLECGCIGDPKVEIPKSFRFMEKQWAEATI